jgi:phage anti-repressor protein
MENCKYLISILNIKYNIIIIVNTKMNNFKNVNLDKIIKENSNLLTVKELLNIINCNINNLYFDKFWPNITNEKWIYIDNELVLWLDVNKKQLIELLKKYFIEIEDYNILTNLEFYVNNFSFDLKEEKEEDNKYIIVSLNCFKELCMYVGTKKSKEIKKYYIKLEKIYQLYLEYQVQYYKQQLENNKYKINDIYYKRYSRGEPL